MTYCCAPETHISHIAGISGWKHFMMVLDHHIDSLIRGYVDARRIKNWRDFPSRMSTKYRGASNVLTGRELQALVGCRWAEWPPNYGVTYK